ncbi:MAG: VanW family protein [Cytophagaceae bacterium]
MLYWLVTRKQYAVECNVNHLPHMLIKHSSLLLRPLKDVDMQYQYNKITNLKLAIGRINNIIIPPGKIFSFWYLVGAPEKSKGYLKGLVLHNGSISYDYGGGLCQLGNLIYWMALHTPLSIAERWRHGYDVFPDVNRTLPFGSGATLAYNYIDLQLKNETDYTFQLTFDISGDHLHGRILCSDILTVNYEVYEKEHFFSQESWGGYTRHNVLCRKILNASSEAELADEKVAENHAIMMYSPFLKNK